MRKQTSNPWCETDEDEVVCEVRTLFCISFDIILIYVHSSFNYIICLGL